MEREITNGGSGKAIATVVEVLNEILVNCGNAVENDIETQNSTVSGEYDDSSSQDSSIFGEKNHDTEITSTSSTDGLILAVNKEDGDESGIIDNSDIVDSDAKILDITDERFYPKTKRELKSLLELSKEAKLPTNLSNRRKTFENVVSSRMKDKSAKVGSRSDRATSSASPSPKRSKSTHFPFITTESELESGTDPSRKKGLHHHRRKSDMPNAEGASDIKSVKMIKDLVKLKPNKDMFCWRCHHSSVDIACETCPRAYHQKCLKQAVTDTENWPCPECVAILRAENVETRSKAMKEMTLEHLCSLLKYAVKRMINCSGSEPFMNAVDEKQFPEYKDYIVNPMDLAMLEKNIKNNLYGSTQAFEADAKWILHNSIIFNSYQSRLTVTAKILLRICKQEMSEIENCSSCYLNANTKKKTWFVEVCPKPHLLVWAKLKGFPYWPAKVMSITSMGMVDVRFFGAHDRSWVHLKDCLLYSNKDPNSTKQKKNDIIRCVKELDLYVENLRKIYGEVKFAPFKTPLKANNYEEQLKILLPSYKCNEILNETTTLSTENNQEEDIKKTTQTNERIDTIMENKNLTTENNTVKIKKSNEDEDYSPIKMKFIKIVRKTGLKRKRSLEASIESAKKLLKSQSSNESLNNLLDNSKDVTTEVNKNVKETSLPATKLKITEELIKKIETIECNEGETPKIKTDVTKHNDTNIITKIDVNNEKLKDDLSNESKLTNQPVVINNGDCYLDKQASISNDSININNDSSKINKDKDDKLENSSIESEKNVNSNLNKLKISNTNNEDCNNTQKNTITQEMTCNKHIIKDQSNFTTSPQFKKENNIKLINNNRHSEELKKLKEIEVIRKQISSNNNTNTVQNNSNSNNNINNTEPNNVEKHKPIHKPFVSIKVESNSDEDTEYMEAKRQYLSALNISEKPNPFNKNKLNEIRTRSKTEERKTKTIDGATKKLLKHIDEKKSINNHINNNNNINKINHEKRGEIYIKPLSRMQAPKQKARKTFPIPNYLSGKKTNNNPLALAKNRILNDNSNNSNESSPQQLLETLTSNNNLVILPSLHYTKSSNNNKNSTNSISILPQQHHHHQQQQQHHHHQQQQNIESTTSINLHSPLLVPTENNDSHVQIDSDVTILKEFLPERITNDINDILCQPPPPKLKPKPKAGPFINVTDCSSNQTSPSGNASTKVNSVADKLSDYFRSIVIETIEEISKTDNNRDATIANLRLQIEELNHKHAIELIEIKRNVSIVLKDIQKSIVEERERIINETKANCELEMIKKIEEAKSKQWCANCTKEAQFYCCWNTSYCDYSCQQKHWSKHMGKCSQTTHLVTSSASSSSSSSPTKTISAPQLLKNTSKNIAPAPNKSQKVYVNRANTLIKQTTNTSGHITIVESTPGNYELIGNGPIAVNGKLLPSTTIVEQMKRANVIVTSTSSPASTDNIPTTVSTTPPPTTTPTTITRRNSTNDNLNSKQTQKAIMPLNSKTANSLDDKITLS